LRDRLPHKLSVLDVFAGGCGGWSLGLEAAHCFRTVAQCEKDPFRRAMLSRVWPNVRRYDDIRDLTASRLRADGVPAIDVLAGSPPCQDASPINQRGRGIEGPETGLFFEWLRLVREIRPRWALAENSARLTSRGIDRVLNDLGAEGYKVECLIMDARAFGAPHERKRSWIIAWEPSQVGRPICNANATEEPAGATGQSREEVSHEPGNALDLWGASWREAFTRCVSLSNGVPPGDARKLAQALGDSILPQISKAIGAAIVAAEIAAMEEAT
jgi:DNA (cytosine-5)-methyltransferase 1